MLSEHGCKVAPSTYYDAKARKPSARERTDERWKPIILGTWEQHHRRLGDRKLWLRLRRDGHQIARCTVERLMRDLGIGGVVRGKRKHPADVDPRETRPSDLVDRHFRRFRTNQLWALTSRTCGRGRGGCTSRSCSTRTRAGSSAGGPPRA
ncbi:IS3 family transposase [Blautia wexlerae]|uniref:IS3 family transposase n=1 Tax=Blautia wexlerae TaxID=418240 RepID=UPI0034A19503